ncbi:MAG: 50S ribosomal protein L13 [Clostridiales bacterium]|jgi:large subunit ribosomal protein L13|nr:50S ribosomal protein L13 [Clostridiales bacterium]
MKTYMANAQNLQKEWFVVDVAGMPAGRAAAQVAGILRGKHKPTYTPHIDSGDFVIVLNTDRMVFTGKKLEQRFVRHHTLYPGGLKEVQLKKLMDEHSDRVFIKAVKGMLPKNPLGRAMVKKMHVYRGDKHEHAAQQPKPYALVKRY